MQRRVSEVFHPIHGHGMLSVNYAISKGFRWTYQDISTPLRAENKKHTRLLININKSHVRLMNN